MKTRSPLLALNLHAVLLFTLALPGPSGRAAEPAGAARVVNPGPPPSDAIVLFDGKNLDAWESEQGGPARWRIEDGAMVVVGGTGNIRTRRAFGDCQLHIEWATPEKIEGEGQGRGNSGVFLMGRYEVQILDSWQNPTYQNGQAGAVYGQAPPLVNASRPPGQWQTYDIIFRAPRRDGSGKVVRPATITVLHNGVLVQDHFEIRGSTYLERPQYEPHPDKLPLVLQDHGNPVRFRNIWIREL
ncbi:3-keto-disaccharide hydrolase [Limisphaera sp. VF-2]|uniref:3-keto-disaccharide hydrolase n=1 Tax=Limisphaera sp. VF-2 TaxID=3400418 RepID=UPI0017546C3F